MEKTLSIKQILELWPSSYLESQGSTNGSSVNYGIHSFFRMLKDYMDDISYIIGYRDSEKNQKSKNENKKNNSCFLILSDWLEPIQIK